MKKYKSLVVITIFLNIIPVLGGHKKILTKEFIRYLDSVIVFLEVNDTNKKDLRYFKKCKLFSTKPKGSQNDMTALRYCNNYFKSGLYNKEIMNLKLPKENNKFLNKQIKSSTEISEEKEFEEQKNIKKETNLFFN